MYEAILCVAVASIYEELICKTDKHHPKIELFTPPWDLYYLVFNVKILFWQKPTITSMFTR